MKTNTDAFTLAYLECAVWSSSHDDFPMDRTHSVEDFAPEAFEVMRADCARFLAQAEQMGAPIPTDESETTGLAGHDFWLTRNGHGAGFNDGDWAEPFASAWYAIARTFGESHLLIGDDDFIHVM